MGPLLRLIAGGLLVLMGLYISRWWTGLTLIEAAGGVIWKQVQPLASRMIPINTTTRALTAGTLWGFLPCGLVYSVLAWTATMPSIEKAVMVMAFFGGGTFPAMIITGLSATWLNNINQHSSFRYTAGVLVILFGLWTIAAVVIDH
jgi:sulfite exporter TauE/SafE